MALAVSLTINTFVVSVFAHGLSGKRNDEIVSTKNDPKQLINKLISIAGGYVQKPE